MLPHMAAQPVHAQHSLGGGHKAWESEAGLGWVAGGCFQGLGLGWTLWRVVEEGASWGAGAGAS